MDYLRHYTALMERAKGRQISGYSERHHIVPRCMGGSEQDNLVRLTAEEHYVAHQLLVKMHPGNHKLLWALSAMTHRTAKMSRPANKRYAWLRKRFAEMMVERWTGHKQSAETRAKQSAARLGRKFGPHSAETRAKMSASSKGRRKSDAHRKALAAARLGKKRGPHSENHRAKLAESCRVAQLRRDKSIYRTPEYREKQAAKMREIWAARKQGVIAS